MSEPTSFHSRQSFTLVELLIVIGIVAVLSVVVVLVLNPAELLKQTRDSNRLSDMQTLNAALSIFQTDSTGSLGTASTVYVSVADTSGTCANLGLPSLPSGWSYHCVATTTLRNVNGTGWIPVDFTQVSAKSPLSSLPVDAVNTTSSGLYYTYTPGGSWELTALMESAKYASQMKEDGGADPAVYEKGTDLALSPFAKGLVGYWPFDEGSGSTTADASGYGNTGTWNGTGSHWDAGRVGSYAGQFLNGTSDYVAIASSNYTLSNAITYSAWVKFSATNANDSVLNVRGTLFKMNVDFQYSIASVNYWPNTSIGSVSKSITFPGSAWTHFAVTQQGTAYALYVNGLLVDSGTTIALNTANANASIGSLSRSTWFLNASVDDIRMYNRALSASEVQAIYNATK